MSTIKGAYSSLWGNPWPQSYGHHLP